MKWYTSDLHFSHKRIVEFTNRAVETTQELHDRWLIDLWNSQVSKGHLVYHMGDFSFAKNYEDIASVVYQLNGQKIFIKGNHDRSEHLDQLAKDNLIAAWYDYKEIKIAGTKTCLFHFPISSWANQSHGSWHCHGHSHGNHVDSKGKMLDVGLDSAYNIFGQHKFFSEEDIQEIMQKKSIYTSDAHMNKE